MRDPVAETFAAIIFVGGATSLALVLAFALMMPAPVVAAGPIRHDDPIPLPDGLLPPPDPYPCFPGEGKHQGFGNGHGRAGAVFRCLYGI